METDARPSGLARHRRRGHQATDDEAGPTARRPRLVAVLLALAVLVVACGGTADDVGDDTAESVDTAAAADGAGDEEADHDADAASSDEPRVLRIGQTADIVHFDPWFLGSAGRTSANQLYEVLVRYDNDLQPHSELAEEWEIAEDSTSITLHLREDVRFHSGRTLTTADVVASLEEVLDEETGANIRPLAEEIADVEVVDDRTIVFHYDAPNPTILDFLDEFYIVDGEAVDERTTTSIGSGPFRVERFEPGTRTTLVRHDDYWGDPPSLDEIVITILPDEQAALLQLQTGNIDFLTQISPQVYQTADDAPGLTVGTAGEGASFWSIDINVTRGPFGDPAVREAMALAMDKQRMIDLIYGPSGPEPACLPVPSVSLAYFPDLAETCRFDLDAASEILEDVGLGDGFEFELLVSSGISTVGRQMAEIYQADLASIGVTATIEDVGSADGLSRQRAGDFDMYTHNYGRSAKDPAFLFGAAVAWRPDINQSQYRDPEYEALVAAAGSTADVDEREALYREIIELVLRENFVVPTFPSPLLYAHDSEWDGFAFSVAGDPFLAEVTRQ